MCKSFTAIRDAVETAGSLAGNYVLPGSSVVTDNLVSKGAQKNLSSPLGKIAQLGTGLVGSGVGESLTGLPSASEVGAGWTNAGDAVGGVFGKPSLGTDISSALSGPTGAAPTAGAASPVGSAASGTTGTVGAGFSGLDTSLLTGFSPDQAISTAVNGAVPTAEVAGAAPSGGVLDWLKSGVKGITPMQALSGAGAIASAVKGNQPLEGENQLKQNAALSGGVAGDLANTLSTGKLPPGAQASIDKQVNDSISSIKSKYAQMGLSGSDMERQAIDQARATGQELAFKYASEATQTGLTALGASDAVYTQIMQNALQKDQGLTDALAKLASSGARA